jgi:nucleoside-diphosphate-sugar epimerase
MLTGAAKKVAFFQADISSESSTRAAFDAPWPRKVSNLPLTVFHTAAAINACERQTSLLYRCTAVNTTGSLNIVNASKECGADILIVTSSASLAVRPPKFWTMPWQKWPKDYVQILDESDAQVPVRQHGEYFGNYGYSKAMGERLVLEANSPSFKTGAIRPGNGIYGNKYDQTTGNYLKRGDVPT